MTSVRTLIEESRLPKIPGQTFGVEMMRRRYHKPQLLKPGNVADGGPTPDPMPYLAGSPGIMRQAAADAAQNASGDAADASHGAAPEISAADAAAARTLSQVVLAFQGFFKEAVFESRLETERARRVTIHYYCEDDTIQVTEPRTNATGCPTGTLVRRHRIPFGPDGPPIGISDLVPGNTVVVYGKSIRICSCDPPTRTFLQSLGHDVPEDEPLPEDPVALARMAAMKHVRAAGDREISRQMEMSAVGRSTRMTPQDVHASRQFFQYDGQVLRFYAAWDDTASLFGDFHVFVLTFYLSDGTMQTCEVSPPNSGRDLFPTFLKRQKVPIDPSMAAPGYDKRSVIYYTAADLKVGATLNIFGRPFIIYDCDDATKQYIIDTTGETPQPIALNRAGAPKPPVRVPPSTGMGDDEDALASWTGLVPKAPRRDLSRFLKFTGSVHSALRFQMRFASPNSIDAPRRFVLTYMQADGTVQVFERQQRNSGFSGGQFLSRAKVRSRNPDGSSGKFYTAPDFFIGAEVDLHGHKFVICGSDERTISYMEQNPLQFPHSDVETIVKKLRSMLASDDSRGGLTDALQDAASNERSDGKIFFWDFAAALNSRGLPLSPHEMLTLSRYFDSESDGYVAWRDFVALVSEGPGADVAATVTSPDRSWRENLAAQQGGQEGAAEAAVAKARRTLEYAAGVAQGGADKLLVGYRRRPQLWRDVLRKYGDHSQDGHIGQQELRKAAEELGAGLNENEYRAVAMHIFVGERERVPLVELARMFEGTSSVVNLGDVAKPITRSSRPLGLGPAHGGVR